MDDGAKAVQRRRLQLAERLGYAPAEAKKISMRNSLQRKSKLEDDMKKLEGKLDNIRVNYTEHRKQMFRNCGHFRAAFRQVTIWAKSSHDTIVSMINIIRKQRAIDNKINIEQDRFNKSKELFEVALLDGKELAESLRRRAPTINSKGLIREVQTDDLQIAMLSDSLQSDLLGASFLAAEMLANFCGAAFYRDPVLRDLLPCGKVAYRTGKLTAFSMKELGEHMEFTVQAYENAQRDGFLNYGSIRAPTELLDITELIDIANIQETGTFSFQLNGPTPIYVIGGRESSNSAGFERGGPFFCSDSLKLDNIELESLGILFYDKDDKLIGPQTTNLNDNVVRVGIKLAGPFTKAWRNVTTRYAMADYKNIQFSYHLPTNGYCRVDGVVPALGGSLCRGGIQSQPDPAIQPLPSPYAKWTVTVLSGMQYIRNFTSVKIVANLIGVENSKLICRRTTTGYRQIYSPTIPSNLLTGTTNLNHSAAIVGVIGGLFVAALMVLAVVIRQRRIKGSHDSVLGIGGPVGKKHQVSHENPLSSRNTE